MMTRGEQIRALSRLTVTVLATYGTAAGTTRTLGTVGRGLERLSVPALSLSADGALVLQRVVVPAGRAITTMGGGPGAAICSAVGSGVGAVVCRLLLAVSAVSGFVPV
ncbi:hypothetical protein F0U61_43785 [Archangium violaceum]|uniref:hypothetical protein n=1 Tax=Archangium violaceum TaxID=83451 RepID=UPI002B31A8F0|nr:hypothetical protein F0U61_43785 [Archangium violaceum]